MAVHYFHCTDGTDLLVDATGRDARSPGHLRTLAVAAARDLMAAVPSYADWDGWAVNIYDDRGEVGIVPFLDEAQNTASWNAGSTDRPHSPSKRRSRMSARVSPVLTISSSGSRKRVSSRPAASR